MKTSIARVQPTNCFVARNQPSRHCSRTSSVAVRAEDPGFCRDKVAIPSGASTATVEGETTLVFLGAQGQRIELAAKKVHRSSILYIFLFPCFYKEQASISSFSPLTPTPHCFPLYRTPTFWTQDWTPVLSSHSHVAEVFVEPVWDGWWRAKWINPMSPTLPSPCQKKRWQMG